MAARDLAEPGEILHGERPVEAHVGADARQCLGSRRLAGNDERRIAGAQAKQEEDDGGDDQHDRHRHRDPERDQPQHQTLSTPQVTMTGDGT